jgi:hypothetical protein
MAAAKNAAAIVKLNLYVRRIQATNIPDADLKVGTADARSGT